MIAEDLPAATQALLTGNSEALPLLAGRDRVIDGLCAQIGELVSREILLRAPVASDLRFLLSVLRIVPELERSRDLVAEIAPRLAKRISRLWPEPASRRAGLAMAAADMGKVLGHCATGSSGRYRPAEAQSA